MIDRNFNKVFDFLLVEHFVEVIGVIYLVIGVWVFL